MKNLNWILLPILSVVIFWGTLCATSIASAQQSTSLELSKLTTEIVFKDPEEFKNQTYCYFVYQGIINESELPPKLYTKFVKGSTLSNSAIRSYKVWLKTTDGKHCKNLVGKGFHLFKAETSKSYTIFLNKKAIEESGELLEKTLNHERLHAFFAARKDERHNIINQWKKLSDGQKDEFKKQHPGYDYSNESVLLREYFSYTFENSPEDGLKFLLSH
jgi:hypothetical protein